MSHLPVFVACSNFCSIAVLRYWRRVPDIPAARGPAQHNDENSSLPALAPSAPNPLATLSRPGTSSRDQQPIALPPSYVINGGGDLATIHSRPRKVARRTQC